MVFKMHWLVHLLGPLVRPVIRWYATTEVIACGLRDKQGALQVIFSPHVSHHEHALFELKAQEGTVEHHVASDNYIRPLIRRFSVEVPNDTVLQVRALRTPRGQVVSPHITVKETTVYENTLLTLEEDTLAWAGAATYQPMIYFIAFQNGAGECIAGLYSTAIRWKIGTMKNVVLTIGDLKNVHTGADIHAELMLVDYEGWVSHRASIALS